jgi:hypothetical protein
VEHGFLSAPDPRTFNDYIDTLAYHLGGSADERNAVTVRSAILSAYRDLALKRSWNYYWSKYRLEFNAPYNTGTVTYVQATQALTISGGSWPSWAGNGYAEVRINNVVSRILSVSGAVATLHPQNNPGVDIATATAFNLYQSLYPLPSDFRTMERPVPEKQWWFGEYIDPQTWMVLERQGVGQGTAAPPTRWTVMGDDHVMGGRMLGTWPYPNVSGTYDFMYQRMPRPLALTGVNTRETVGTISCSALGTAVTGVNTTFNAAHVGAALRFGTVGQKPPTGRMGTRPYVEQVTIQSVTDTTHLVTATPLMNAYTAVPYLISDPVDMNEALLTAFERRCEMEVSAKKSRSDLAAARAEYLMALREAYESDKPVSSPQFVGSVGGPIQSALRYMPQAFQWTNSP